MSWRRRLTAARSWSTSFMLLSNSRPRRTRPTVRTICGDERNTRSIATCYGMSQVAVERVIRGLRYLCGKHPRRKRIRQVLGYLRRNRHRMGYAEAAQRGLPIGSWGNGSRLQDVGYRTAEAFRDALARGRRTSDPDAPRMGSE